MSTSRAVKDDVRRRVLGIDPGTAITGWGVIEERGRELYRVASGVVRLRGPRAERLETIYRTVLDICIQYLPGALSIEKSFVGDNIQTAFRLGEARGAAMVAAAQSTLCVREYSPAQIKVAVTGSGRAVKAQMVMMVEQLLRVDTPLVADEADALAAAICDLNTTQFTSRVPVPIISFGSRRARWRSVVKR